jgi:hypothetical protein
MQQRTRQVLCAVAKNVGTRAMPTERRDLDALEKAVNDAAGRANSLWVSFILFATLVVITTGTVTHKHL